MLFAALAPLGLFQSKARRIIKRIRRPIVGDRNGFSVLNLNDAQNGDFGHASHAVISGFLAVDQAFFGHIFEQLLERDFLLTFQPKFLRDFTFSGRARRVLDKLENLFARRKADRLARVSLRQVSKPAR